MSMVLDASDVYKTFRVRRRTINAVDGVSLTVAPGETVGLVGESGSGKSTFGRIAVELIEPDAGVVTIGGRRSSGVRNHHAPAQMVFQDPFSSLDPTWTVLASVAEPVRRAGVPKNEAKERAAQMLLQVGLPEDTHQRRPRAFSGGQRQRVAIARALVVDPMLVVCDEAVASLDVSTQAQIISLLGRLQARTSVGLLFISHDLAVVRSISHRIAVMYRGRLVEVGETDQVCTRPAHPYTTALLASIPGSGMRRVRESYARTEDAASAEQGAGCAFRDRCPFAMEICAAEQPASVAHHGVVVACHLHDRGPKLGGEPIAVLTSGGEAR